MSGSEKLNNIPTYLPTQKNWVGEWQTFFFLIYASWERYVNYNLSS